MKNQYVGDIGDFGKYGLLKAICGHDPVCPDGHWPLGVVWYLTPNGGPAGDGNLTNYLLPTADNARTFRRCDPALYDALKDIVGTNQRNVPEIRMRSILPPGATFFEDVLSFDGTPHIGVAAREGRKALRDRWLRDALASMGGRRVVFLDPDNGFAGASHEMHHTCGPKYVFMDELRQFVEHDRTVVVYHHLHRNNTAAVQVANRIAALQLAFPQHTIQSMLYRRGTLRAYFIISTPADAQVISRRLEAFLTRGWRQHFDR